MTWKASFTANFDTTMEACRYFGWTEATIDEPCSWGGISCNDEGTTFGLSLRNIGIEGTQPQAASCLHAPCSMMSGMIRAGLPSHSLQVASLATESVPCSLAWQDTSQPRRPAVTCPKTSCLDCCRQV